MPFQPQTKQWTGSAAVLLVHGIGNVRQGDYPDLVAAVQKLLGAASATTTIYQLVYDGINDWFADKTQLATLLDKAKELLKLKIGDAELSQTVADYAGDVLWPVLSLSARAALKEGYMAQLTQIVKDGTAAGVPAADQSLSIITHSLGCFHTYEALHAAAKYQRYALQPASDGVRFANVIFMASPVQLIRTVSDGLGSLVPNRRWMETASGEQLTQPGEQTQDVGFVKSVDRWVSITGSLDPVGGHLFRKKLDWAYMEVPGQISLIDDEQMLNINTKAELVAALKSSLQHGAAPDIKPNDPHSWIAYVNRNATQLNKWLVG
jgi:hypothetical protein